MTMGGWLVMAVSVGFVTTLFGWCILKVLSIPQATEHLKAQPDIDTRDQET